MKPGSLRAAGLGLLAALALFTPFRAAAADPPASWLDRGYHDLYDLEFNQAHRAFQQWEQLRPEDPLGPASDAAAYLFSEFDRLHILESELFVDDAAFEHRSRPAADPLAKRSFDAQIAKAGGLIDAALARNPDDFNALFSQVLVFGLQCDYQALIEKHDLRALSYAKQGRILAQKLLSRDPAYYDAYLAIGVENYLLSLKPAPVRWVLKIAGAETDKETGLAKLRLTAEKGHYMQPYARLLLAVAALRDHNQEQARALLEGLAREFPHNHLYWQELAKLR
jgi:hypothetical protein